MKAAVCTAYGSPEALRIMELAKPSPGDNEVLIKIHASTVTMGDCELRNLTLPLWTRIPMRLFMGFSKPKNLVSGMELSGTIEAVGKNVSEFKPGDEVFGSGGMSMGGNAEYKCQRFSYGLAIKPPTVSFEDAATISVGGINALHFLRKANIQPGQHVLINGAGGSIGTYGVLLAKLYGAEVTAVDSTNKLDALRAIGADHVIDYTKKDFSENGVKYDVILDMVYKSSFSRCVKSLKEDGCYLMANTGPRRMLYGLWVSWVTKKRIIFSLAAGPKEDLLYIANLIAEGKLRPLIDKRYPLDKIAEAHEYVEKGNKKGNVIITVTNSAS